MYIKDIDKYIYKKNSSYDGFISFLNNNYDYWINKPIKNYECNELSFIFDSLIILENQKDNLNYECYENFEVYEYVNPIVNYNHKEYLLYNFEDIIKNYLKTIKAIYNIEDQI